MTSPHATPPPPPAPEPEPKVWPKRVFIAFLIVANVAIFGTLLAVWLGANAVSRSVSTIPAGELPLSEKPIDLSDPRTFLLIGSDSRANLDDLTGFGAVGGQRADVVILVKVIPEENRVQMLSLPRDLKVTWNGSTAKLNAPFNEGAAAMVETVHDFTGLPIHHYMQVDFAGFADIVDAIGGVEMTFPFPARDRKSGFAVDAGTHRLMGKQAVAFARSRSYEENRDGTWVFVDASDFGRTRRQQDILMAMITQIERPSSIDGVRGLLDALGGFVFVDSDFDETEIIQLAWGLRNVGPGDLDAITLPAQISNEGGVSYVVPVEPAAGETLAAFAAGRRYQELPESFTIQVLNGNGRSGAAAGVAETLTAAGYDVAGTGDSGRSDYSTTLVISRPNLIPLGERVVAELGLGRTEVGRTPDGIDVVVIVGLDAPL